MTHYALGICNLRALSVTLKLSGGFPPFLAHRTESSDDRHSTSDEDGRRIRCSGYGTTNTPVEGTKSTPESTSRSSNRIWNGWQNTERTRSWCWIALYIATDHPSATSCSEDPPFLEHVPWKFRWGCLSRRWFRPKGRSPIQCRCQELERVSLVRELEWSRRPL